MSAIISDYTIKLGVNIDGTVAKFSGNIELYEKFILRFTEDKNFSKLNRAISESNKEILFYTRTFQVVTGNFGFERLYEIFADIVAKFRADDMVSLRNLDSQLKNAYESSIGVINGYKENIA